MLPSEIVGVCWDNTTHLNTLHGQNIESWNVELGTYTGLKIIYFHYRPVRKYLPVVTEFGRRQIWCSCSFSVINQAVPPRTRLGKYGGCLTLRSPVVTICSTRFNIEKSYILPHTMYLCMCSVWIWEQTAIISLYSINWMVFITESECVYYAVRIICFIWISEQTAIISIYSINWLVFITECVYCAMRTIGLSVQFWFILFLKG